MKGEFWHGLAWGLTVAVIAAVLAFTIAGGWR